MSRIAAFFSILLIALALGGGSIAHASEGIACFEENRSFGLSAAGGGQGSPDADQALVHHHGGCHGHHAGLPDLGEVRQRPPAGAARVQPVPADGLVAVGPDPALRPPRG